MKYSEFVFDFGRLLYYKCHKIIPNHGGSYRGSLDWIKNRETTINPANKKDNKYFQYLVTATLNHKEIGKNPEAKTKIKSFMKKYKQEGMNFSSGKDDQKKFEKNNWQLLLMFCMLKKKKYILPMFQNITKIVKNKFFF